MTEIIHQSRGTIDKYKGDAIMSLGAPLGDEGHVKTVAGCQHMVIVWTNENLKEKDGRAFK